jgi:hypothetical protein
LPGDETGLMADPNTWEARPIGLNRALCPACKQSHAWNKKDAFLEAPGVLGYSPELAARPAADLVCK